MRVSMGRFEEAVQEAIESVPAPFQPYVAEIEFVVAERSNADLMGYYEGAGALGEADWPARITLFKAAHEAACGTWEELVEEVRRTVVHEIGHHFLMEEDELPF